MTVSNIWMEISGWGWLLILTAAVAIACSYWLYRETIPTSLRRIRMSLFVLRSLAFVLVILLLFAPYLHYDRERSEWPVVAVLMDRSESMTLRDGGQPRDSLVRSLFLRDSWRGVKSQREVRYFGFAGTMEEVPSPDSTVFDGQVTDIGAALKSVRRHLADAHLTAIVLLSDGQNNYGPNPSSQDGNVPIFAIGVGDTAERRDAVLRDVAANEVAYRKEKISVDVLITANGLGGSAATLVLSQAGRMLESRAVVLPPDGAVHRGSFEVTPDTVGMVRYDVRIVPLRGELSDRNNERSFVVNVLKNRFRWVLISGAPGPDHVWLRNILMADPNVDIATFVERADGSMIEVDRPWGTIRWDETDGVVLNQFPTALTSKTVMDKVRQSGKPIFFFNGPAVDGGKISALESALCVRWNTDGNFSEMQVWPSVTLLGKNSSILRIQDDGELTVRQWSELPPIWIGRLLPFPEDRAEVLIRVDMSRAPNVLKIRKDIPLVVSGQKNGLKSIVVGAYGLWKAQFMMTGLQRSNNAARQFVQNGARWLTTRDDSRRVIVRSSRPVYQNGEPVRMIGQVYDEQYRPIADATIQIRLRSEDRVTELQLHSIGNGRYEAEVKGLASGDYQWEATASRDDATLGEDRGKFAIEAYSVEFAETRLREDVLTALAEPSGGLYRRFRDADSLLLRIPGTPRDVRHLQSIALWQSPLVLFTVILVLTVEWILRKRNDML